jgi:hypothetical protein
MARRSLSMQGRIVAAGVSIAVGSALVGFMAAGDHSADATQSNTSTVSATGDGGGNVSAIPADGRSSDDGFGGFSGDDGGNSSPQPQTRTGGS